MEQLEEVQEAIVIGQAWDNDVRVVLFVVLKPGHALDKGLRDRIKRRDPHRRQPAPRAGPHRAGGRRPRAKSGKIAKRFAVRDVVHGREVEDKEALANPEALELFRGIAELGE